MADALARRSGKRSLLGAAAGAAATAAAWSRPAAARAQPAAEETHAGLLRAYVAAWNAGDVEGVVRLFAADAVVAPDDGHSYFVGATTIREWVRGSHRAGDVLSGHLDAAGGRLGRWRLAGTSPADERLRLPPVETLVDVEVRDGRIAAMRLTADPAARERRAQAVASLAARVPSVPPAASPPAGRRDPSGPAAAGWVVAAASCLLAGVAAAARRRA